MLITGNQISVKLALVSIYLVHVFQPAGIVESPSVHLTLSLLCYSSIASLDQIPCPLIHYTAAFLPGNKKTPLKVTECVLTLANLSGKLLDLPGDENRLVVPSLNIFTHWKIRITALRVIVESKTDICSL